MTIERGEAHRIQVRAMRDWLRWLGAASDGARALELPGVTASVVPVVPERSIANGVAYATPAELEAAHHDLVAAYADAGIRAWTVWTPEFDADAVAMLEARGHAFDGNPVAMVLDLADLETPDAGGLDWDAGASPREMGELNDVAYGHAGGEGVARAFGPAPEALGMRRYRARVDGELACVLATMDHGEDAGVYFVATAPQHRGRKLASALLGVALARRAGAGCARRRCRPRQWARASTAASATATRSGC